MGAADAVPGVSGGTVALVLGHYQRLVTAISRVDSTALRHLAGGRLRAAADHIDLRFLIALGGGIGAGILTLAGLMHWLLEHRLPETMALFFGLVLASTLVVARGVGRWRGATAVAASIAALGAFLLCGLTPMAGEMTPWYLFGSAMIAISAMILPGISGAFVLLLLGMYYPVTGLVKDLTRGETSAAALMALAIFASGCVVGLLLQSRLLRWLLTHYPQVTYAALLGLMLGSLRRLWPLQRATGETAGLRFSERQWEVVGPAAWNDPLWHLVALAAAGFILVVVLDRGAAARAARAAVLSASPASSSR